MKKNILLIVCLMLVFAGSGCGLKQVQEKKHAAPDEELFQNAESLYKNAATYRAVNEYEKYIKKYPAGQKADDAFFRIGEIHLSLGNTYAAKEAFEKLIKKYPAGSRVNDAKIKLLQTCYKDREYEKIIKITDGYLKNSLPPSVKSEILSVRGASCLAINNNSAAATAFSEAISTATENEKSSLKANLLKAVSLIDTSSLKSMAAVTKNSILKSYLAFQTGVNLVKEQNYSRASATFKAFLEEFPDHELAAEANLQMQAASSKDPYSKSTIGCLLPLTGKYRIFGTQAQRGIELALASFKPSADKKQVKIVVKDTGSREDKAAQAVKELADQGVMAIIGPVGPAEASVKGAAALSIPIIALTSKDKITEGSDFVFRNFITSHMQAEAVVSFASSTLGARKFAVLYPEEAYGKTMMKYFSDSVAKHGGEIAASASYPPGLTDFTAFIKRIAPKPADSTDANTRLYDVLYIPDSPKNAGLILSQLNHHNLGNIQVIGTNLWNSPKIIQAAGETANGAIFPDGFTAKSHRTHIQEFVSKFSGAYGEMPGIVEAAAYDSAMILFEIVSQQEIMNRFDIKNSLHSLKDYPGITGLTGFDENGEAVKEMFMIKIENGEFTEYR